MRRKWTSFEKWSTVVAVAAIVAGVLIAVFVPEVRIWLHLEKPSVAVTKVLQEPQPSASAVPTSPPTVSSPPTTKVVQHSSPKVKGNGNVAGNNVSGNKNVVGNNNQVTDPAPVAIAPNGIAIAGGNVTNPTVNNFAPPTPPPAVIQICISPPKTVEGATAEVTQVFTLTTDSNVEGPTYIFDFSGNITERTAASSPDMAMNIGEKQTGPSQFGFRLFQTWFPGQRINVQVHSQSPVRLIKVSSKFGETFESHEGGCGSGL